MYKLLHDKAEGLREDLVGFAQELVRTPSTSLEESKVADLVESKMNELGFDRVLRDDVGNVVGVLLGREAKPALLLNSHMDTVAPDDGEPWSESPYSGRIEGGFLYGVGASDCKGGLAAQVFAAAMLKRCLLPLRGNLVVAATVAEENGLSVGVRTLIEKTLPELHLAPDYVILGEATGLGLYYGHDGWMEMDVRVEGANPFQVEDAAQAIVRDFRGGDGNDRHLHVPTFDEENGLSRASIRMDRRLRVSDDTEDVLREVKHQATLLAQENGPTAVSVRVRQETQRLYNGLTTLVHRVVDAWSTDPFDPLMERSRQALAAAGCQVRPGKWQLGQVGMGTAGSVLVSKYKLPALGYGPGSEAMTHAVNECVEVEKMFEAMYGTAAIAHALVGIPVCGWTSDEI